MKSIITIFLIMLLVLSIIPMTFALDKEAIKKKLLENREQIKQQITAKRTEFKGCKDLNSTGCTNIKKELLLKTTEEAINYLTTLKERVDNSTINETYKQELSENLNDYIQRMQTVKTEIENAQTKQDLNKAAADLKNIWNKIKKDINSLRFLVEFRKLDSVFFAAEKTDEKLQASLEKLTSEGKDTTKLVDLIKQYETDVDTAKTKYEAALDLIMQLKASDTDKNLIPQIQQLHKDAIKALKDAQTVLKEIVKELKSLNGMGSWRDNCTADRPNFRPGYELGYFIWQSKCKDKTWNIAWSGDWRAQDVSARISNQTNKTTYKMTGTITSNGQIFDVGVRAWDKGDKLNWNSSANTITFDAKVGPHFDAIHFRTKGDTITYDIFVNGEHRKELVYIGNERKNPDTIPFDLKGSIAETPVCKADETLLNEKCVKQTTEVSATVTGTQMTIEGNTVAEGE